jgi:hypothetical protein
MASSRAILMLDLCMNIKIPTEYSQFLQEMELVWGIIHTENVIRNQRVQYEVH